MFKAEFHWKIPIFIASLDTADIAFTILKKPILFRRSNLRFSSLEIGVAEPINDWSTFWSCTHRPVGRLKGTRQSPFLRLYSTSCFCRMKYKVRQYFISMITQRCIDLRNSHSNREHLHPKQSRYYWACQCGLDISIWFDLWLLTQYPRIG